MIKKSFSINHNILFLQSENIIVCNLFFVLYLLIIRKKDYLLLENLDQLTLKQQGRSISPISWCFFEEFIFWREGETLFFFNFNIIISQLFSENFIEISQVVQKILRVYLPILAMFIYFHQCFRFFVISM